MGCGGSKTDETQDAKQQDGKQRTPQKNKKRSRTTISTESSPARREPRQKKAYVAKRRESEPVSTIFKRSVPLEGENLPLSGNWELETGVDVSLVSFL